MMFLLGLGQSCWAFLSAFPPLWLLRVFLPWPYGMRCRSLDKLSDVEQVLLLGCSEWVVLTLSLGRQYQLVGKAVILTVPEGLLLLSLG